MRGTFDRYVVVDWSAANRPRTGKDSVWVCSLAATGECRTYNPRTRGLAKQALRYLLAASAVRRERVLAGFDFPLGYPSGFAAVLGLAGEPWRGTWELLGREIADDPVTNVSNRFEVANRLNRRLGGRATFWGLPATCRLDHLPHRRTVRYQAEPARPERTEAAADPAAQPGQRAAAYLPQWRQVERLLRDRRHRPHSTWQLAGAGSVGSQALTGIPVVAALRAAPELLPISRVWPFETGPAHLRPGEPAIVHAEVWPSLHDFRTAPGACTDEKQVWQVATDLRARDAAGGLAETMSGVPAACRLEEGWIVGVDA